MGLISKSFTFLAGASKSGEAAQINSDYDTIYAEFNGNIEDANIKAAAAIAQSKIANLVSNLATVTAALIPSGSRTVWHQTAAPTGWTKDTTAGLNDNALRIVTGSVTPGGAVAFSTVHSATRATTAVAPGSTDGFTLTTNEMPSHVHGGVPEYGAPSHRGASAAPLDLFNQASTAATGGGAAHSHAHTTTHTHTSDLNVKYQDVILAQKD